MGGLLSAEVALLESHPVQTGKTLRHRIVGTINFDTPFLGMHPGVVVSGIGSLFRPAPDTPGAATSGTENQELRPMPLSNQDSCASSTLALVESRTSNADPSSPLASPVNDPNYNPPFPNDVRMATRTGWGNALHFINKHSDSLARATRSYVTSYFEFGGCLADYNGLKDRYARLRALEEADSRRRDSQRRVRFVNYYTASTGRPKKPKLPPRDPQAEAGTNASDKARDEDLSTELRSLAVPAHENEPLKGDLVDDENELLHDSDVPSISDDGAPSGSTRAMAIVDAAPIPDSEHPSPDTEKGSFGAAESDDISAHSTVNPNSIVESSPTPNLLASTSSSLSLTSSLPPMPAEPQAPPSFDPSLYPEKDARKLAEKEHSRQTKAYERAVKDRDKEIKDRRKLLEKREKAAKQTLEKQLKLEAKEVAKAKKHSEIESSKMTENALADGESSEVPESEGAAKEEAKAPKPKKDKKFCMLPPRSMARKIPAG
ncbi:hypothetical protein G7Y79_00004g013970 [Physcia stellaris]|nr:hypothetical protein G7Y79_00004g013970 [Physcia stellaris]